jgi:hypothetical protein
MVSKIGHMGAGVKDNVFLQMVFKIGNWAQVLTGTVGAHLRWRNDHGFVNVIGFAPVPAPMTFWRTAFFLFFCGATLISVIF